MQVQEEDEEEDKDKEEVWWGDLKLGNPLSLPLSLPLYPYPYPYHAPALVSSSSSAYLNRYEAKAVRSNSLRLTSRALITS